MIASTSVGRGLCLLLGVVLFLGGAVKSRAADELNLEIKLIWGTNDDKSPDPHHKKLDSALTKWLSQKLKWKNYFEENQSTITVPLKETKTVQLSKDCKLEVKYLGNSRIEVNLWGKDKHVIKGTHTLPKNDRLVIAGDDKNDTAWFIAIKIVPNK